MIVVHKYIRCSFAKTTEVFKTNIICMHTKVILRFNAFSVLSSRYEQIRDEKQTKTAARCRHNTQPSAYLPTARRNLNPNHDLRPLAFWLKLVHRLLLLWRNFAPMLVFLRSFDLELEVRTGRTNGGTDTDRRTDEVARPVMYSYDIRIE